MKNILVTGSSGYIGSVLTQKLVDQGYFVTGLDTLFYKNSILFPQKGFPFRKVDIRNIQVDDLYGFDTLIHLAALSNDSLGNLKKEWTEEINYKETLNLARKSKKAGLKRFIFSSSCSVYGIAKKPIVDEKSTINPLTYYAKTKVKSEKALKKLADETFTVVLMRNSTVYGFSPAFRDDLVVNNLTSSALALGRIEVNSDGTPWRPLIDVRDLSEAFIKFLSADSKKINGEIINVGFNENNFQINSLVGYVKKAFPRSKITFTSRHVADTRSYRVDFGKFHKIVPGFKQEWDMEKSVFDLFKNLKKYNYTRQNYLSGTYSRQNQLKDLLKKGLLTDKLFWAKNSK